MPETCARVISLGGYAYKILALGGDDEYLPEVQDGYGADLLAFASALLTENSVVVDIGANIGLTSLLLARLAGTVVAVEPAPNIFSLLKQNITDNRVSNVIALNYAIGASNSNVRFREHSAFGHVSDGPLANANVEMRTVDNLVADLGLSNVSLIKIDVEGYEPHVLAGAAETIARFNPVILMEFNTVTLTNFGGVSPHDFAVTLFRDFEIVLRLKKAPEIGYAVEERPDTLVHFNVFRDRSVTDLILIKRARPLPVPRAAAIEKTDDDHQQRAIEQHIANENYLAGEVAALKASRSWRLTAPLRAASRIAQKLISHRS